MSEPIDDEPQPHAAPRRSDFLVALTRMEAKLDVAIAQDRARLDEHSRRLAIVEASATAHESRIGSVERKQAEAEGADKAKPAPQPWTTYVALGTSLLLALYVVLNNYAGQ